jgi:guanine deaminase
MNIIRGRIFSFLRRPEHISDQHSFTYIQDGGISYDNSGIIKEVDDYKKISNKYKNPSVLDFGSMLVCPGFIDTHNHFPQTQIIASYGTKLLDWLNKYTFPNEALFSNESHCEQESKIFLDLLNSNGITSSVSFGSVHPTSVQSLFKEAEKRNMNLVAGNVLMDRNAPQDVLISAKKSYENSKKVIRNWHGKGRCKYAVTPRFAITSTPELMEIAQTLIEENNTCYLQTHLSENLDEIKTTLNLFPDHNNYLSIYEKYKLLSEKTLLAHSIHLERSEQEKIFETKSVTVHCPTSNLFLGSGLYNFEELKRRGIRSAISTDVGGGTSFSMLRTLDEAYKIQQLQDFSLNPLESFYWATLGNAKALGQENEIGIIRPGNIADLIILNSHSTPLMSHRMEKCKSLEEELFILQTLGDDRAIESVFIAGKKYK